MYRVLDMPRLFDVLSDHNFGGQSCTLQINLTDSFWPVNAGSWRLIVENGSAILDSNARPDVEIELDIAEFSALITGATAFRQLLAYGLATISDASFADVVHQLFYTPTNHYAQPLFRRHYASWQYEAQNADFPDYHDRAYQKNHGNLRSIQIPE